MAMPLNSTHFPADCPPRQAEWLRFEAFAFTPVPLRETISLVCGRRLPSPIFCLWGVKSSAMFYDRMSIHPRADLGRLSEYAHAAGWCFCRLQQRRAFTRRPNAVGFDHWRPSMRPTDGFRLLALLLLFMIDRRQIDLLGLKVIVVCVRDGRLYASNQDDPLCE
jgi:hypothetical protein